MTNQIDWTDHPPFGREVSLKHTLELLHERRMEVEWPVVAPSPLIVEIGTSESYSPDGLGNALLAFAWYAHKYGARVKSVDVREGAVKNSLFFLRKYVGNYDEDAGLVEITHADAYEWATEIHEEISLLYVDAGYELIGDPNYTAFVKRHPEIPSFYVELFNQFDADCFKSGSLMLIDDTSPESFGGKGIFLIPFLLDRGWRQVAMRGVPVFPMVLLEKM